MTELQQLGHYRIEAHLGSNAHVDVYRAIDSVRKRTVALKVFKPEVVTDKRLAVHLLEQAQLATELVHPHIAWVWETGEFDEMYFVSERYANGPSLTSILADTGPIPWEQTMQIMRHIAQALGFANERKWTHGNITPGKVILSPELGAVLTDFGVIKALTSTRLLGADIPISTAPYTAPEIWDGQPASPATDQYALACIFAECLTAKALFGASTKEEIQQKHLASLELSKGELAAMPWQIAPTLRKALALNPSERYKDIIEFIEAPSKLAAAAGEAPEELAQREAEAAAWREAAERARQATEEAARKEAVEQARREMEEQLRKVHEREEVSEVSVVESLPEPLEMIQKPRAERRKLKRTPAWRALSLIGLAIIVIIVVAIGIGRVINAGGPVMASVTSPSEQATRTFTPTITFTPSATALPSPTPSPTLSPTTITTNTPTLSSTPSPTATIPTTSTLTPTPTRTPKENGPSVSIRGDPSNPP